jgi:hypothetical protein
MEPLTYMVTMVIPAQCAILLYETFIPCSSNAFDSAASFVGGSLCDVAD